MGLKFNHPIKIFIYLVTLANLVLAGDDTVKLSDGDEGQNIFYRLFRLEDSKYTTLTPHETLERLKRLVAIYDSNSYDAGESAYSEDNQKLVRDLLSVFKDQRCSKENMEKYNEYIRSQTVYGNLVRALRTYREEKYQNCKSIFTGSLFSSINSMGAEQKARLMELRDGIVSNSDDYYENFPFYTSEAISESVLRFLAKYPGQFREKWKKAKMLPKEDLIALYGDKVAPLCSDLSKSFKNSMQFFASQVASDKSLYRMTDGFTQGWIMIGVMCNDILEGRDRLIDNVYDLMYSYAHPKRRTLFKWVRDTNKSIKDLS